ncbi:MAG: hypothetical protein ACP5UV_04970 [Thermoplasmata archaeon]
MSLNEIIAKISIMANEGATLSGLTARAETVIISVSAVIISILWIPIAFEFFSSDDSKRYNARIRLKNAVIGTIIYIMAISGVIYALFKYIVMG